MSRTAFLSFLFAVTGCATSSPVSNTVQTPGVDPAPATAVDRNIVVGIATTALLPAHQSGDRLTAIAYEGEGGVLVIDAFYDELLQIRCDFVPTGAGAYHCLPEAVGHYLAYTDTTCASDLVEGPSSPTAVSTWVSTDGQCGEGHYAPYTLGASVTLPGQQSFERGDGACSPSGMSFDGIPLFQATPVALATYVEAEVQLGQADDAYSLVLVAEDGTRSTIGVGTFDGTPCTARSTDDGLRCLPQMAAWSYDGAFFGDATCSESLAFMANPSCDRSYALFDDQGDFRVHPLDGLVDPATVHHLDGSSCDADEDGPPGGRAAFAVGQALPTETWPRVERLMRGTNGIQQAWYTDAAGTPLAPDPQARQPTVRGEFCQVAHQGQQVVCVPGYQTLDEATRFADAACTEPLVQRQDDILLDWVDANTHELAAAWVAGAPYTGARYTLEPDGSCAPTPLDAFERIELTLPVLVPAAL